MSIELAGMAWDHDRGLRSIAETSKRWSESHPDVRIDWTARSLREFGDQPLAELTERYDVLVIDHPHVAEAAAAGLLAPFPSKSSPAPESFVGRSQHSYVWHGDCYGLAVDAAAQVSVHRPDLIAETPDDWDEVIRLARTGRVLWAAKPIDAFASLFTLCSGIAGVDAARGGVFAAPDVFDEAWSILRRLIDAVPRECLESDPIRIAEELASRDDFVYAPLAYGYTNYSRAGYRSARLHYRDIPTPPRATEPRGSMLGGAGLAVSATAADVRAAQEFALWAASADVQTGVYFDAGGQPGHRDAWADERLDTETAGFFSATRRTLDSASLRPPRPGYVAFQDAASVAVWTALSERAAGVALRQTLDEHVKTMEDGS